MAILKRNSTLFYQFSMLREKIASGTSLIHNRQFLLSTTFLLQNSLCLVKIKIGIMDGWMNGQIDKT